MDSVEKLQAYKDQGKLFHGSLRAGIDMLIPQRATDVDTSRGFNIDTAIFATPLPAVAVAFACVNTKIISSKERAEYGARWGVYYIEDRVELRIPRYFERYLDQFSGFVYVLERKTDETSWQVKLYEPTKPIDTIKVSINDFAALGGLVVWR
ncbi:MAG: hypothetical protein ACM3MA_01145 [Acidobacteriota bacterium]